METTQRQIDALAARLDRIERSRRRWRLLAGLAVVAAVGVGAGRQALPSGEFDELRCRLLIVAEPGVQPGDEGKPMIGINPHSIVIGGNDPNSVIQLGAADGQSWIGLGAKGVGMQISGKPDQASIWLATDREAQSGMRLGMTLTKTSYKLVAEGPGEGRSRTIFSSDD